MRSCFRYRLTSAQNCDDQLDLENNSSGHVLFLLHQASTLQVSSDKIKLVRAEIWVVFKSKRGFSYTALKKKKTKQKQKSCFNKGRNIEAITYYDNTSSVKHIKSLCHSRCKEREHGWTALITACEIWEYLASPTCFSGSLPDTRSVFFFV